MKAFFENLSRSWRKLLVFVIATVLTSYSGELGLSDEQVQALAIIAGSFLVGQGVADWGKGAALVKSESPDP